MTTSPSDRPPPRLPPAFADTIIERALGGEPATGLDPSIARMIAATLASDDQPALGELARTGRIQQPELSRELASIRRTFRPHWLAALRQYVAALPVQTPTKHPHPKGGNRHES